MKEPFVRLIKRDGATMRHKIIVRIVAILLALVVDAIFIYGVTGLNPLAVYGVMFEGTFATATRFSWAMRDLVTLLCIGIALAPAFKMKFWNIGAEGQGTDGRSCHGAGDGVLRKYPAHTCIISGDVPDQRGSGSCLGLCAGLL